MKLKDDLVTLEDAALAPNVDPVFKRHLPNLRISPLLSGVRSIVLDSVFSVNSEFVERFHCYFINREPAIDAVFHLIAAST